MVSRFRLLSALALLAGAVPLMPLHAQTTQDAKCAPTAQVAPGVDDCPDPVPAARLPVVTVSATLNPRPIDAVAADVSVITRETMDRHLVDDLRDLIRYEPGVSVTSTPGRYGQSGFSIRGLGGNRVRMEVDGIPISDAFSFGSMLSAGRNMVDLDSIKRVEIIRGPASSLYGSDALGGVVSYVTKDPIDYLRGRDAPYVSVKGQYDSVDRGSAESATFAAGSARNGFMLLATHRHASATNNMGEIDTPDATRTRPDPQRVNGNNVLAKYVHGAKSDRVDRVALDIERTHAATDVLSAVEPPTASLRGNDRSRRTRLSFGQAWKALDASLADSLEWKMWGQRSRIDQRSIEVRASGPGYERHVEGKFTQRVFGLQLHAFKHVSTGAAQHDVTWGVEASRTRTRELRDGHAINLADGTVSQTTAGGNADNYPVRDFPPSDTTRIGVFAQDEIRLAGGRLRLIPAICFDRYRFAPRADALFDSKPLATHVVGQTDHHVSPKLGVVWQFTDHLNAYAQYASGFRAPPYSDLGALFPNLRYGYAVIPNPKLKPETSRSFEVGLRGENELGRFTLAAYTNRYRDFIASEYMVPREDWPDWAASTPGLMFVFQSVNLTRARIRGFEASGVIYLDALSDALSGWRVQGSVSAARGDVREGAGSRQPLGTVDPARAVLGIGYDGYDWGVEMHATAVARKDRLAQAETFRAPGHATVDIYAHWSPVPALSIYAGVTNLTNRKYWDWGNLHGGAIGTGTASSSVIDRYTAPGRALSVAARWTF